ncbi:hypothetical protein Hdeb2414_s0573g00918781 [Helianthus debilis subsp. tardiflorus]
MDRDVPKAAQEGSCARGCEEEASCNLEAVFQAIVGPTLEVIQKKRSEKPEVRDAATEAVFEREIYSHLCLRQRGRISSYRSEYIRLGKLCTINFSERAWTHR